MEDKNVTLDEFLAKNTSEDNLSFEAIMGEAEKKERAKVHQSWLHEKEQLHQLVRNLTNSEFNSNLNKTEFLILEM